ncbi:MAG: universal stress protein [Pseudomonadota bacterium]
MKTIIVAFDGTPGAATALEHAVALSARDDGRVIAVFAHASAEVYVAQGNWIPHEARAIISQSNARLGDEVRANFELAAKAHDTSVKLSFESIEGRVDDVLARRSRAADLLVTARVDSDVDMHALQHPDQIALRGGRPLLIVPTGVPPRTGPVHAVVAWDGKRAAARALADALPLMPPGSRMTLLTIGSDTLTRPVDEVIEHLAGHRLEAEAVAKDQKGKVADVLIDYCAEANPDLLVMGAYEHSKFQVGLVGGPTLEVLRRAALPVLMSH